MGKKISDRIGEKFGKLTILSIIPNSKPTMCLCKCDCGNEKVIRGVSVTSNRTSSCGCLQKEKVSKIKKDLTGKTFNKLLVLKIVDNNSKYTDYLCKCECGNEKIIRGTSLTSNHTKSCGCLQKENAGGKLVLLNQKFGKLTVIDEFSNDKDGVIRKCQCDCGTIINIKSSYVLKSGHTTSCGCIKSKGEEKISSILHENNIEFSKQVSFYDLITENDINKGRPKFDFIVTFKDLKYIIEFDGIQHFTYEEKGWNTKEHFELLHRNDLIKNKYCFENNIQLIRIPYVKIDTLSINDLKIETSEFLLNIQNESEYYNKYM